MNLAASVRPHDSGGATLRLGPLQHEAAWLALEAFLGRPIDAAIQPVDADEGYFGEHVAAAYDEPSASVFDSAVVGPAVAMLAELAGDEAALEFAIGTGRIALPLAERGVRVIGIDNSEPMLVRLREKPGAERIDAMVGDMAATRVDGEFSLVYLVFNTIFNLTTQDGQVACFENAAAHLRSGGRFVIEARVPEIQRLPPGQTVLPCAPTPMGCPTTSTTSSRRG